MMKSRRRIQEANVLLFELSSESILLIFILIFVLDIPFVYTQHIKMKI